MTTEILTKEDFFEAWCVELSTPNNVHKIRDLLKIATQNRSIFDVNVRIGLECADSALHLLERWKQF